MERLNRLAETDGDWSDSAEGFVLDMRIAGQSIGGNRRGEDGVRRDPVSLILLLSWACASHPEATEGVPFPSQETSQVGGCVATNGSPAYSIITGAELQRTRATNLYDAIRRIRPAYFGSRGPHSIYNEGGALVVVMNRHVIGDLEELRTMGVAGLACVRRLPAAELALITGITATEGAVELVHGR